MHTNKNIQRAINRKLHICLHMQIHNISPSCQLPLCFQPLCFLSLVLTLPHPSLPLQLPSCLSSPLSDRILITLLPPRLLLSLHLQFVFLQKLIFLIHFLCLSLLSSSLGVTHRLLLPPLHPSVLSLSRASFIWKASTVAWVLPPSPRSVSSLLSNSPPTCSPSLPQRQL